jgi:hypothetical protein
VTILIDEALARLDCHVQTALAHVYDAQRELDTLADELGDVELAETHAGNDLAAELHTAAKSLRHAVRLTGDRCDHQEVPQ